MPAGKMRVDIEQSYKESCSTVTQEVTKVMIICGFLGSGKTTLLNRMLAWELEHEVTPQVIMSEFGDLDVDGLLIRDKRVVVTRVLGGCTCCDLREELANSLKHAMISEQSPRIYIEATGVADPAGIFEALTAMTNGGVFDIGKIVVVYDASRHWTMGRDQALVQRQLSRADIIVLNKCDLVTKQEIKCIADDIAKVNPSVIVMPTVNCMLEPEDIIRGETAFVPYESTERTSDQYRSFAFLIDNPLSRPTFERWLSTLPPSVVRVKGFVQLQNEVGMFEIQAIQKQYTIVPFDTDQAIQPMIIVIAHPMRTDGLIRGLEKCIAV
ncbi:MAG: GTP-binding protein [Chloroflexota bacterium]|nr:GTP-binding protein [Chloroflexota bacterium]